MQKSNKRRDPAAVAADRVADMKALRDLGAPSVFDMPKLDPKAISDVKEFAAEEFEPWDNEAGHPPSNTDWKKLTETVLVPTRIARVMLGKTKPELRAMMKAMPSAAARETIVSILTAQSFYDRMSRIAAEASRRVILSMLATSIEESAGRRRDGESTRTEPT
jgi:hypothetical protein